MFHPRHYFASLALVALSLFGCVSERRIDQALIDRANQASARLDWLRAQDLWSQVLAQSEGRDASARLALATAFEATGSSRAALQVLRGGAPPVGKELDYALLMGRALLDQGNLPAAGKVYTDILTQSPNESAALIPYGTSLLDGPGLAKGVGLLLRSLRLDPGDGSLAELVANRAAANGLALEEAEAWRIRLNAPNPPAEAFWGAAQSPDPASYPVGDWLQAVLRLDPQHGAAWRQLGQWNLERGDTTQALRSWREAVRVDPGDTAACLLLARYYAESARCAEARPWIEHALAFLSAASEREPFEALAKKCEE